MWFVMITMNFFNKSNIKSVQATKVDDIKEREVLNEDVINTIREFQAMKQDFKHGHFGFKYDVKEAVKKYEFTNNEKYKKWVVSTTTKIYDYY
jgi:hypothetical protein